MHISQIMLPGHMALDVSVQSRKQLICSLACMAEVRTGLDKNRVFETLSERERLGSTVCGRGVALPRGCFEGIDKCHLFFMRTKQPVKFEAEGDVSADLFFCLLGSKDTGCLPEKLLIRLSRMVSSDAFCNALRQSRSVDETYAIIKNENKARLPRFGQKASLKAASVSSPSALSSN